MGRPTKRSIKNKKISESMSKLTPDAVQKLEQVFSLDCSITEICSYLDIARQTYYNWEKSNKKLFDKLERLRERPVLKARKTVSEKVNESYSNAMDYLKRKRKDEFGDNVKVGIDQDFRELLEKINGVLDD